jgi:membrane associated rhomboid family serine protease
MASYPQKQFKERISLGQSNNALTMLIIINLVIFAILGFIKVIFLFLHSDGQATALFNDQVLKWFVVPADLSQLASRPWTLLTGMFVHVDVWSTLANMLWLWTFGYIMQDLTGNKKIIPIYIYGGLAGVIAFIAAFNIIGALQPALPTAVTYGGSAGITAIAIAVTMTSPSYRIFPMLNGGIPLWILTMLYLVISIATVSYKSVGNYVPHIAGAMMGALFIMLVRMGYDWSEWMNNFFDWFNNLFNPDKPKKGANIKEELFYKSSANPYKKTPNVTQQRVDDILDKINQKGYHFLTEEEKELLKRASQEDSLS